MSGLTVGVTGASGFLGSHLALELLARGHRVVGIVRDPARASWLAQEGVELRQADLLDPDALGRAFAGLQAVVSNAAPAAAPAGDDLEAFVRADRSATENVVNAALAQGVPRLVQISSVAVYRVRWPFLRVREDHPRKMAGQGPDLTRLVTRRGYAESKALSEEVIWEAIARGLQPTVLRPGPVYGSRDPKLTARYLRAMSARFRMIPTVRLPHVHAGDVAQAVCGALANPASIGKAYNITGEPLSLLEVARAVRQTTGARTWLIPVPLPLWMAWDNSAAEADLGVRYRSLADGLREAFAK
jgi:nucleoside-diphosphate-sugar epimerase